MTNIREIENLGDAREGDIAVVMKDSQDGQRQYRIEGEITAHYEEGDLWLDNVVIRDRNDGNPGDGITIVKIVRCIPGSASVSDEVSESVPDGVSIVVSVPVAGVTAISVNGVEVQN